MGTVTSVVTSNNNNNVDTGSGMWVRTQLQYRLCEDDDGTMMSTMVCGVATRITGQACPLSLTEIPDAFTPKFVPFNWHT